MTLFNIHYIVVVFSLPLALSCTTNSPNTISNNTRITKTTKHSANLAISKTTMTNNYLGYNFDSPDDKFKLNKELKEISGLTAIDDKWLAVVQDERGAVYLINIQTGDVDDVIEFSADGDYEGIASVDNVLYALRADGVLFQIKYWKKEKKDVATKVIDTNLGEINNTEGLVYDSLKNRLLIACKGSALIGEKENGMRAIYAYDLEKNKFKTTPIFTLDRKDFKQFVKNHREENPSYALYKKEIKKAKKRMLLKPSGIAIHPITKDFYLLSAAGNSLVVLDRSFKIKHLIRLPKDRFEQPEGLTFNSKGDLFLSSEGLKKKARIYKFNYLP